MAAPKKSELAPANTSNELQAAQPSQADRMIELAITNNADIDKLDKLLGLKERYDKEEARKQFTAALAAFKAEPILITKDKKVKFKNNDNSITEYNHASLGNIIKIAVPYMSAHGLSHRWLTEQEKNAVTVTCILTHSGGHSEKTSLFAGADSSGRKNEIQKVASTITYLERYTFLAITGLAVEDQDDDGQSAGAPSEPVKAITENQANKIHAAITENELDMDIFMGWIRKVIRVQEIADIPKPLFDKVMAKIKKAIADKAAK